MEEIGGIKEQQEEDSESDDDDVQIMIGEIKTENVFNRQPSYQRLQLPQGKCTCLELNCSKFMYLHVKLSNIKFFCVNRRVCFV